MGDGRVEEALAWADEYFTHPNVNVLAAALREAQAEIERLREALDESDRIIGAMCRDGSFFATLTSDALRERLLNAHAANRGALAPADEAKP